MISCTLIGSRQILNKRPHVRGLATSKRGARVISHSSIFWARHRISESTLRDARADSESGRVGSVGPLPILNLNCTCESCRHLACRHSETMIDSESTSIMDMPVRYACMACQNGCSADSYFRVTTYQPLLVLPIRASDSEAGGSGAA